MINLKLSLKLGSFSPILAFSSFSSLLLIHPFFVPSLKTSPFVSIFVFSFISIYPSNLKSHLLFFSLHMELRRCRVTMMKTSSSRVATRCQLRRQILLQFLKAGGELHPATEETLSSVKIVAGQRQSLHRHQ